MFEELQRELDRIAAEPLHWTQTKILGNEGGILADARKFLEPDPWPDPRRRESPAVAAIQNIFRRFERVNDDEAETSQAKRERRERAAEGHGAGKENVEAREGRPITSPQIAEAQRDREKGVDDEEGWRAHLGDPGDDARAWLKKLCAEVDVNVSDKKGWWGTLLDHVQAKPVGAKIRDLDPRIVELCLKKLCED